MFIVHIIVVTKVGNIVHRRKNTLLLVLGSLFLFSLATYALAAARPSPYIPGDTLDPTDCSPGETNCFVSILAIDNPVTDATQGSVFFAGASGALAQDNANLFWDDTNNRLGVGTVSPLSRFEVRGGVTSGEGIRASTNAAAYIEMYYGVSGPTVAGSGSSILIAPQGTTVLQVYNGSGGVISIGTNTVSNRINIPNNSYLGTVSQSGASARQIIGMNNNDRIAIGGSGDNAYFGGRVGIGSGNATPAAQLQLLSTTEQLRVNYDASNYLSVTVASNGRTTLDTVGSSQGINISDVLTVGNYTGGSFGADIIRMQAGNIRMQNGAFETTLNTDGSGNFTITGASEGNRFGVGESYLTAYKSLRLSNTTATYAGTVFGPDALNVPMDSNIRWHSGGTDYFITNNSSSAKTITTYYNSTTLTTQLSNGNFGIGTAAGTASARLHLLSTTEQLRIGYDASNYYSTTVGLTGGVTFDAVGSGSRFTFSDTIALQSPVDGGNALLLGDTTFANVFGIRQFGGGAGTDRYTMIGQNITEASSIYNVNKQGGALAFDDRSGVDPVRLIYKSSVSPDRITALSIDTSGNLKVGNIESGFTGSAAAHIVKTTEQLRIGYNTDNYFSVTVASDGDVTFNTTASAGTPTFTFSDATIFSANITVNGLTVGKANSGDIFSTAFGVNAGNASGTQNTTIGYHAGEDNTGTNNVHVGIAAGGNIVGNDNTIVGALAASGATSGGSNTIVGRSAGSVLAGGGSNVFLGSSAGLAVTTGSRNVLIGPNAGLALTTGVDNIMVGFNSGNIITTGNYNVFLGRFTGTGFANSTSNHIFFSDGNGTLRMYINGSGNLGIGTGATVSARTHIISTTEQLRVGYDTSNYYSTTVGSTGGVTFDAVGAGAGFTFSDALTVSTDISGNYTGTFFNDGNNADRSGLRIQSGLDDHTAAGPSTLIGFFDGDGTSVGSITFGSSATAYNTTSDQRLKTNITDTALSIDTLRQIKVRDYTFIEDATQTVKHGFIAQELFEQYPEAVTRPLDESTGYWMVDYSKLSPLMVKAIQDLDVKISDMTSLEVSNDKSLGSLIKQFLSSASNTITDLYAKAIHSESVTTKEVQSESINTNNVQSNRLCLEDLCITKAELQSLLNSNGSVVIPEDPFVSGPVTPGDTEEEVNDEQEEVIEESEDEEGIVEEEPEVIPDEDTQQEELPDDIPEPSEPVSDSNEQLSPEPTE